MVLAQLQRLFPNGRIIGMDLFDEGLKFARQRFKGMLIQGDVLQHSFGNPFDLIGAFDHVEVRGHERPTAEAPCVLRRPAPDLGADSDAVLREVGYSAAEIARLREAGVV